MDTAPGDGGRTDQEARERLRALHSRASRGLWALVLFAAVSLWARTGFRYFPSIPEGWRDAFGRPPPPSWINPVFILYVFSAMILSITRMAGDPAPFSGFRHVGYLVAFYIFYHVAGALEDGYWAVLTGGFAVLTIEAYRNWLMCREQIREESDKTGWDGRS